MRISAKNLLILLTTKMTHFTDRPQIEEMPEILLRDELEELLESDSIWDLDMDDESCDFESYLGSNYDF